MQAFQTHTAAQPISIQLLQTQQKPRVTEARHNAEKHSLFLEQQHQQQNKEEEGLTVEGGQLTFQPVLGKGVPVW